MDYCEKWNSMWACHNCFAVLVIIIILDKIEWLLLKSEIGWKNKNVIGLLGHIEIATFEKFVRLGPRGPILQPFFWEQFSKKKSRFLAVNRS